MVVILTGFVYNVMGEYFPPSHFLREMIKSGEIESLLLLI